MQLPESFMQELKFRNSIVDIASSYVNLKRRGHNLIGLCPFHSEKTPSFNVYKESESFYCFGCGVGGDVITFIRMIENLDYIEAVKFLADRCGMNLPENTTDDSFAYLKNRIYEINREAARFFNKMLYSEEGKEALMYLKGRGLSQNTITHFGLGFSPKSKYALVNHLASKGFKNSEMVQANLAYNNRNGNVSDRFFNRVMFPIIDLRGNVIAFGGRIMGDLKPKYLNTSDTPVFKKNQNLFSMNFAKKSKENKFILAEGYMDVIALNQAGFDYAIATLGTSLTKEQVRLMSRYTNEVIIAYDSDEAGQKATKRAISLLRQADLVIRVLTIPKGKDPDEFIKSYGKDGPLKFKQLLENSENDVMYSIDKIKKGIDLENPDGKIKYLTEVTKVLSGLESKVEREVYASKVSEEIGIEKSTIMMQIEKLLKKNNRMRMQKEFKDIRQNTVSRMDRINPEKYDNLRAANAEEALIAHLINNPENIEYAYSKLEPDKFSTEFNKKIYKQIIDRNSNGRGVSLTDLSQDFSVEEISRIAKMLSAYIRPEECKKVIDEYIDVIVYEGSKINNKDVMSTDVNDIKKFIESLRDKKK